jgi:hypothetical protein
MDNETENNQLNDIEQVKNFLITLGFKTTSDPSAQHLIYCKETDTVIIRNIHK